MFETRILPADLAGIGIGPSTQVTPGQTVNLNWSVTNYDSDTVWWTGFQVNFGLRRDYFGFQEERYLGSRFLPTGFPGYYSIPFQSDFLTLPDSTDSFWTSNATYSIVMIVDATNAVFETNEFNNVNLVPLSVSLGNGGGGGGGQVFTDLSDLPATGEARGAVLSAVMSGLKTGLTTATAAQTRMASLLSKVAPVPNSSSDLKNLAASIKSVTSLLTKLASGSVTSVTLSPGVVLDQSGLDLVERYLKYVFEQPADGVAARALTPAQAVASASSDLKRLIPGYETYEKASKWVNDTRQKINDTADAIRNAPNKAVQWVADLFGRSGVEKGNAERQAKVVEEGGENLRNRVQEMDNELAGESMEDLFTQLDSQYAGAPKIFALASSRLKAAIKKNRESVFSLEDQVINLETWSRHQSLLGTWQGNYDWQYNGITYRGAIALIFKPAKVANQLVVTLANDFYLGSRKVGQTRGTATGQLGADGVFRGQLNWSNGTTSGSGPVEWRVNGRNISGNIFEDPNITLRVAFAASKITR